MSESGYSKLSLIVNAVLFQLTWFSLVLDWFDGFLGLSFLLFMLIHIILTQYMDWKILGFILGVAGLGMISDSLMTHFEIYQFGESGLSFIPLWLVGLWFGFSMTINYSLSWLIKHPKYFVLFTAMLGPVSYFAGNALGADIILDNSKSYWMVAQWFFIGSVTVFLHMLLIGKSYSTSFNSEVSS